MVTCIVTTLWKCMSQDVDNRSVHLCRIGADSLSTPKVNWTYKQSTFCQNHSECRFLLLNRFHWVFFLNCKVFEVCSPLNGGFVCHLVHVFGLVCAEKEKSSEAPSVVTSYLVTKTATVLHQQLFYLHVRVSIGNMMKWIWFKYNFFQIIRTDSMKWSPVVADMWWLRLDLLEMGFLNQLW